MFSNIINLKTDNNMKDIKIKINIEEIRQRLYQSIQGDNAKLIVDAIINTCEDEEDTLTAVFLASVGIKPKDSAWEMGTKVLVKPNHLSDWSFNKEEMEKRKIIKKDLMAVEIKAYNAHKDTYTVEYDYVYGSDDEYIIKTDTYIVRSKHIEGLEEEWPI